MEIIRQNAFRILGLPVTATTRDIVRRQEELEAYRAIGSFPSFDTDFLWIGDLDRSDESVKKAIHTLGNSRPRLEHSLFWFWETSEDDKSAILALREGNTGEAARIWASSVKKHAVDYDTISYLKNWAVLLLFESFQATDFDNEKFNLAIKCWGEALSSQYLLYRLLLLQPELREEIENDMIAKLVGKKIHSSAKRFLSQWVKDGDYEKATDYVEGFSKGGFPQSSLNWIISDITDPIRRRIDELCEEMEGREFTDMDSLLDGTYSFYNDVHPLLEELENLIGEANINLDHYPDRVANIIRNQAVGYGNGTDDWQEAKGLSELANTVAKSELIRGRLTEDILTWELNIRGHKLSGELKAVDEAPKLFTFNGIGTTLYGRSNFDLETDSYETTLYFVVLFIPLFPLRRYRVVDEGDGGYRFLGRLPLREHQKLHMALFLILTPVILALLCSSNSGDVPTSYNSRDYSTKYSYYGSKTMDTAFGDSAISYKSEPLWGHRSELLSSLKKEIEDSRNQLQTYESKLSKIDSLLNTYEAQRNNLKGDLETTELRFRYGLVSESVYQSRIDAYDSLVEKYNSSLLERQRQYKEYDRLLEQANDKIDRYNRLLGIGQ